MKPPVRVVAAVIFDAERRVLVTQRTAGKTHAGRWEFPGGKIEAEETEEAALRRELREELGVEVLAARALMELTHEYADRAVRLSVWQVDALRGVPVGLEGQPLRWLSAAALRTIPLLAADAPIIEWIEGAVGLKLATDH